MTMNGTTDDTKTPTTTPSRGEAAVRHLWTRAVDDGDEAKAKLIATIANLLAPENKLAAGQVVPAKTADATVSVDGSEVDTSGMTTTEAEEYKAYVAELDGTARLARHIAQMEADDAEDRRLGIGAHNDGG